MLLYLRHLAKIWLVNSLLLVRHDLNVLRIVRKQVLLMLLESFLASCLALLLCLLELLLLLLISNLLGSVLIQLFHFKVVGRLAIAHVAAYRLLSARGRAASLFALIRARAAVRLSDVLMVTTALECARQDT